MHSDEHQMLREARARAQTLLAGLLAQQQALERFAARPPGAMSPAALAPDTMGRGRLVLAGAIESARRMLAAAESALHPGGGLPQSHLQ